MAVGELLLQSVGDVLRIFPGWPKDRAASFENLRAQGGFLISARLAGGKVQPVTVTSTVGGKLRLVSPWPAVAVRHDDGAAQPLTPDADGIVAIETTAGQRLTLLPQ
jgi:hypothetical protein